MSTTTAIQTPEQAKPAAGSRMLRIDPWIFFAAIGLSICSFVTLRGSFIPGGHTYADKQALYAAIGLALAVLMTRFDYSILREYRYVFYALLIILNLIVFAMPSTLGATRWIPLPLFQFQPSEFGKLLLVLTLAAFAVDRTRRMSERRIVSQIILLALVPAVIVIRQPDLGTGLVYVVMAAAVLFFMGTSWKYLAGLGALVLVAATLVVAVGPSVGVNVLGTYQMQRLTTFVDGTGSCAKGDSTCYQLNEGLIAIGSGGKTGRGAAGASQVNNGYVPEWQDDFIFAVVGETYGFAGAAVVISLYALLIWRTLRILTLSKNLYGTLVAGGILAMLMFQVFVNIGMTIGIMPVTGVPLPLVSYGGSSVIVTYLALGLLQSIYVQARIASTGKARVLLV